VDLEEAEPSRDVLRSEVVGDENPLNHHPDIIQSLLGFEPEVGRQGGRYVDERTEGDARLRIGSVPSQTDEASGL
jgi:hypothetical protein